MPEYLAPGVYVEEIAQPTRRIDGVPTSVAGFVGEAERGPTTPTCLTNWADYEREFGGFLDEAPHTTPYWRLPYAVRGFFENGGQRCYVARVVGSPTPGGGHAPVTLDQVLGDADRPEDRTGIAGLMTVDEIALMAIPDAVAAPAFADALVDRCEAAKNRLAILDDPTGAPDPRVVGQHRVTSWAALYYPHLRVPAVHRPNGHAVVPACGHVAGVIARVDRARGVQKAPANEPVHGLWQPVHPDDPGPLEPVVNARADDVLGPLGVNVIRDMRGDGRDVRVWGARTMSPQTSWKYVSVRRLFIFVEESIRRGTQWVVFEPNGEPTWLAVRRAVENFLLQVWRGGGLAGAKAEEAFFVRCDRSTMTQDDLDNGRLVTLVGVAPMKPAEFVILRFTHTTADRP
ncbi:MAG: phage tail sheath C-terminal domain-containing protein [Vicinamibacterales bacterium]